MTFEQLEKIEKSDDVQDVVNVIEKITPEINSLHHPQQHLSIAGSIIASCIYSVQKIDKGYAQSLIDKFILNINTLKLMICDDEEKPN
jgi:hypothetical protein